MRFPERLRRIEEFLWGRDTASSHGGLKARADRCCKALLGDDGAKALDEKGLQGKLNYLEVELFADDEDDEDKDKEVGTEEVVVGEEEVEENEKEDDEMDAENDDGAETEQMGEADDCNNNDDDNDDDDDDDDNNNNNDDDDDDDDESLEPVGIKRQYCSISKSMKPAPSTSSEAEVRRSYNEHLVKSCHSKCLRPALQQLGVVTSPTEDIKELRRLLKDALFGTPEALWLQEYEQSQERQGEQEKQRMQRAQAREQQSPGACKQPARKRQVTRTQSTKAAGPNAPWGPFKLETPGNPLGEGEK